MKTIKIFFLLLGTSFACCAQTISLTSVNYQNIPKNAYVKDIDGKLNGFVGTWKWTDGNSEFIVKLVKKEMFGINEGFDYKMDLLLGGFKYTLNGQLIANTLDFTTSLTKGDASTYVNFAPIFEIRFGSTFMQIITFVTDDVSNYTGKGTFSLIDPLLLNGNLISETAHWTLEEYHGNSAYPTGYAIPTDVVMIKQ